MRLLPAFAAAVLIALASTGCGGEETWCDKSLHAVHEENAKAVAMCRERGGVAVVERAGDGWHQFIVLTRCDFPGQLRLQGER